MCTGTGNASIAHVDEPDPGGCWWLLAVVLLLGSLSVFEGAKIVWRTPCLLSLLPDLLISFLIPFLIPFLRRQIQFEQ
jgi:hypothetical protein